MGEFLLERGQTGTVHFIFAAKEGNVPQIRGQIRRVCHSPTGKPQGVNSLLVAHITKAVRPFQPEMGYAAANHGRFLAIQSQHPAVRQNIQSVGASGKAVHRGVKTLGLQDLPVFRRKGQKTIIHRNQQTVLPEKELIHRILREPLRLKCNLAALNAAHGGPREPGNREAAVRHGIHVPADAVAGHLHVAVANQIGGFVPSRLIRSESTGRQHGKQDANKHKQHGNTLEHGQTSYDKQEPY